MNKIRKRLERERNAALERLRQLGGPVGLDDSPSHPSGFTAAELCLRDQERREQARELGGEEGPAAA